MNDKLIKLLGLDAKATEADILKAVKALAEIAGASQEESARQSKLNKLVGASAGALDHARAATVLDHQAAFESSDIGKQFAARATKPSKK